MQLTIEQQAFESRAQERAHVLGLGDKLGDKPGAYGAWRAKLRDDYAHLRTPGKISASALAFGILFFLIDSDAYIAITMCNRPMTAAEQAEYSASAMCNRRRKPGESIEDDEERARKRRVASLVNGIAGDVR